MQVQREHTGPFGGTPSDEGGIGAWGRCSRYDESQYGCHEDRGVGTAPDVRLVMQAGVWWLYDRLTEQSSISRWRMSGVFFGCLGVCWC